MNRILLTVIFIGTFFQINSGFAQSAGDFQSFTTGNWTNVNTWERFDGATWINPAPSTPISTDGAITILNAHTITDVSGVTADQVVINSGGVLTINGVSFTAAAGGGDDLIINAGGVLNILSGATLQIQNSVVPPPPKVALVRVHGTINNAGTISNASASTLIFEPGSTYDHQHTAAPGIIPTAGWNITSTCQVTGYTTNSSAPSGLSQNFGNFTWDTGSLSSYIDLNGGLTTVNGNLLIQNVPSAYIYLTATNNYTLTVGGNLTISNCNMGLNSTASVTINVSGNALFSNNSDLNPTFNGSTTLDINGNLEFSGGFTNLTYGGSANIPINVAGDFTLSSTPTINNGGSGTYTLTFDGSGAQNYSASQPFTDFDYIINNGSTVNVANGNFISGSGDFTLHAGGTLGVGDVNGLLKGTTSGNVRVSGTRTYTASGNIIYNGSAQQNLGNEWDTGGDLNSVAVNLEIDNNNGNGVTNNLISGNNIVGDLTLTNGSFNIGGSNSMDIQSNFVVTNGTIGGSSSSDLTFSESGALGVLSMTSGATQLNNLTISRAGTLVLGDDLTINGALALTGNLNFSSATSLTLTLNGTMTGGGGLISNANSNLNIGGTGAFGIVNFNGTGNQLNNLTLNKTSSGTYTWSSSVTVNTGVNLNFGTLTHSSGLTMAANSTFFKAQGTIITNSPNAVSSYNVQYDAAGNTGLEIPTVASALNDLTLNTGGTVTLQDNTTINGNLILLGGTLDASTNDITMAGNANWTANGGGYTMNSANAVNFTGTTTLGGSTIDGAQFGNISVTGSMNAPSANINISGDFSNTGTFDASTGTVTFNGASSAITGNTTTFNNLAISNALTAPAATLNVSGHFFNTGTFNHNNGTVVLNGGSIQIISSGGTSFNNLSLSGSGTKTLASTLDVNGDLTLESGAVLGIGVSNYAINLAGDWINSGGTFNAGTGLVTFDGGTMAISGTGTTSFNDITTASSSILNNNGPSSLTGTLTLGSSSTFDADGSGSGIFTLISNATDDARIATLPTGASVSGNLTAQRYLPSYGSKRWRSISSTVLDAPVSDLQAEIPIGGSFIGTDNGTNGIPANPALGSLKYYDNSTGTEVDDRFVYYPGTTNTEFLTTSGTEGRGYFIWVRDLGAVTFDLTGIVNQGTIDLNLSGSNEFYNLVGNPYPSSVDWDNGAGWTKTQIQGNNIYIWDGLQYLFWNGTGNLPNGIIPMGTAFMVQGADATVALTINENAKTLTTGTVQRIIPPTYLELSVTGLSYTDNTYIEFKEGAELSFDINDVSKLPNVIFNLSSYSDDDRELAINAISNDVCSENIKLNLDNIWEGSFMFNWDNINSIDQNIKVTLLDHYLGTSHNLREVVGGVAFEVTDEAASSGNERFEILFNTEEIATDIAYELADVCDFESSLTLTNPQLGMTYTLVQNGTDIISRQATESALILPLTPSQVTEGVNRFDLDITNGSCGSSSIPNAIEFTISALDAGTLFYETEVFCDTGANIEIFDAQIGVFYTIVQNGVELVSIQANETQFLMPLSQSQTTEGLNQFDLKFSNGSCPSAFVQNAVEFTTSSVQEIASITNSESCESGQVLLKATGATGNAHYNWYESIDAIEPIPNEISNEFLTPIIDVRKSYYVTIINEIGCESLNRIEVIAEIISLSRPDIQYDETLGVVSTSIIADGYKWFKDNILIENEIEKSLEVFESGNYTVEITSNGCSSISENKVVEIVGLDELLNLGISIYPNPVIDILNIKSKLEINSIIIFDTKGVAVFRSGKTIPNKINLTSIKNGIYIINIVTDNEIINFRVKKE